MCSQLSNTYRVGLGWKMNNPIRKLIYSCIFAVFSQFLVSYQFWQLSFEVIAIQSIVVHLMLILISISGGGKKSETSQRKHPLQVEKNKFDKLARIYDHSKNMMICSVISFFFAILPILPFHMSLKHISIFISGILSLRASIYLSSIVFLYVSRKRDRADKDAITPPPTAHS